MNVQPVTGADPPPVLKVIVLLILQFWLFATLETHTPQVIVLFWTVSAAFALRDLFCKLAVTEPPGWLPGGRSRGHRSSTAVEHFTARPRSSSGAIFQPNTGGLDPISDADRFDTKGAIFVSSCAVQNAPRLRRFQQLVYSAWMNRRDSIQAQAFSGHESFPLRFTWLTKAVRCCEASKHRDLFARDDAMVRLGVGKNMVRSIRFWALNTAVLTDDKPAGRTSRHRPTQLGAFLFGTTGKDPFMEDPATVWLLHWQLASNHRLGTWNWLFNDLRTTEFSKPDVVRELLARANREGLKQVAADTIERDLDCLLRTYVPSDPDKRLSREELLDCPLTELGLIRRAGDRDRFSFVRATHDSLPASVFIFALLSFWDRVAPRSNSLRFDQIAFSAGSPGMVFKITENAMVDRLHRIEFDSDGAVRFDETSGLRQALRSQRIEAFACLRRLYVNRRRVRHAGNC